MEVPDVIISVIITSVNRVIQLKGKEYEIKK